MDLAALMSVATACALLGRSRASLYPAETEARRRARSSPGRLHVVIDIYSRYIVTWAAAAREDTEIDKTMLEHAMGVHGIPEAIHADRGTLDIVRSSADGLALEEHGQGSVPGFTKRV